MWLEDNIGNIARTYAGGTPSRSVVSFYKGDIPWVKSTEVNRKSIKHTDEHISKEALAGSSAKLIPMKTPLIAMYGATAGQVSFLEIEATANQAVLALVPNELNSKFLFYVLSSLKEKIVFLAQGSGQPNLSKSLVDGQKIKFPKDSNEQMEIVSILESIDTVIEKTEDLVAKYEQIKQGMMHDLFTRGVDENGKLRPSYEDAPELYQEIELGQFPKEWDLKSLNEVCSKITDGAHFSPVPQDEGKIIANVKDIKHNAIDYEGCTKIIEEDFNSLCLQNCNPIDGDVLLSKDGTIGRVVRFRGDREIVLLSSIAIIRPEVGSVVSDYLAYALQSEFFDKQLFSLQSGSALKRIILKDIRELVFPVPKDQKEQNEISKRLDAIHKRIMTEKYYLEKLQEQKTGLMQDLLTGKVLVNVKRNEVA